MRRDLTSRPRGRPWPNGPAGGITRVWWAEATRDRDRVIFRIKTLKKILTFELTPESAAEWSRELSQATGLPFKEVDPQEEQ